MSHAKKNGRSIFQSSYKLLVLMGLVSAKAALGYVQHSTVMMPNKIATLPSSEAVNTVAAFIPQSETKSKQWFTLSQSKRPWVSYDLGLGKNPSLAERKHRLTIESTPLTANQKLNFLSTQEAVQHWFDYEAVRDFPSPLSKLSSSDDGVPMSSLTTSQAQAIASVSSDLHNQQQKQQQQPIVPSSSIATEAKKSAKSFPQLRPQRSASDVLLIRSRRQQQKHARDTPDSSRGSLSPSLPLISRISLEQPQQKHRQLHRREKVQLDPNTVWVEMLLHHQEELQQATATA